MSSDRPAHAGETPDAHRLATWLGQIADGSLSRRDFLVRAAVLGVSAGTIGTLLSACGNQKTGGSSAPSAMDTTLPKSLRFYNWSEYTSPAVLKEFERKYGVKVELTLYDSNEELQKHLKSGDAYDVIVPEDAYVQMFAKAGLIRPLDMRLIPNFDQYVVGDFFRDPPYDPGTNGVRYSSRYMFGTIGFAVRLDHIADPPDSWGLLYDVKYKGGISMLEGAHEVLGPALLSLGYSYNTTDQQQLDTATRKAIAQKPLVKVYSSSNMAPRIISGLPLVQCWDGDAVLAMNKVGISKIRYVLPSEGYNAWMDGVCVPANAPSPYAAHLFVNFLLDPKVQAATADYIGYQPVVAAADPLLKSLVQRAMRPTSDVLERGTITRDLGTFEDAYQQAYQKVMNA